MLGSRQWNNWELILNGWQDRWALKVVAGDFSHLLSLSLGYADISWILEKEKSHKWRAYLICFGPLILNTEFILLLWIEYSFSISSVVRVKRLSKSKESLSCFGEHVEGCAPCRNSLGYQGIWSEFPSVSCCRAWSSVKISVGCNAFWVRHLMNENRQARSDYCFKDTGIFVYSLSKWSIFCSFYHE